MSGTSMACPHVSGIAALVRSARLSWSPTDIKPTIMTTVESTNHIGRPILDENQSARVFDMGVGHVNPQRELNPGLMYDIRSDDYIIHLCGLGYTRSKYSASHTKM
ncbi:hypothetical protein ACSQ67_008640 [Phaseolus vulgaris]